MAGMPQNFRGDFVYVRDDGTILSNRPQFAAAMVKEPLAVSLARPTALWQSGTQTTRTYPATQNSRHTMSAYPPTLNSGSGPYVRQYSVLGVTAFYGYVNVGCNDSRFYYNQYGYLDVGYLYSGGWGESFSVIDAGYQYNSDTSIQPFIATNYSANAQWTNQSQHYACGRTLMMEYGAAPTPSQQMFLGVGISSLNPTGATPPPNDTAIDAAYVFWNKPSDFYDSGADQTGLSTVCRNCITKRMSSVGQKGGDDTFDGTCFGGCLGAGDKEIAWSQMEMGQFTSCTNNPPTYVGCHMNYQSNNTWYGGTETQYAGNGNDISAYEYTNSASEGFYMVDPTVTFSPVATATYTCTFDAVKGTSKCNLSGYGDWSYTTPSNTQVDSTHQISIHLNSMTNNGSCGDGLSYTVSLVNPSGTTVYNSGVQSSASFSTSYSASAATGPWKWVVHAGNQSIACSANVYSSGTYDDTATGNGSATYAL